ncbi:MAG: hypothetical protein JWP87_2479 [Labilithrix sp.]|nr:hypothetical protein [Labilithrix sp.]
MPRAFVLLWFCIAASACKPGHSNDLEHRVEAALRAEPALTRISVTERRGIVTLSGIVDSEGDRAHLRDVARAVPGVVAVDDRLIVRPPPMVTAATPDAMLAAALVSRLHAADFAGLDVQVNDKTVRVVGTAPRDRHADAMRIVVDNAPRDYHVVDAVAETPAP